MSPPAAGHEANASSARERGNALYKAGNLPAAESAFTEAARFAPKDPRPLSNLSATKFEMGNYVGAALFCERALGLFRESPDPTLEQRIYQRLAKAYVLAKQPAKAQTALSRTTDNEKYSLEQALLATQSSYLSPAETTDLWDRVIEDLPRFKPALQNEPEYYSVGHDDADSLFDNEMPKSKQSRYALLFAGIGDGRNLLATLVFISLLSLQTPSLLSKKFHFTLLDLKPAVFARDLLTFRLLLDATSESEAKSDETLVALSYLYAAQLMPAWAYSRIELAMKDLARELEREDNDIMDRFYVDARSRLLINRHLRDWQKEPQGWYSTRAFLDATRWQCLEQKMKSIDTYGTTTASEDDGRPPGCKNGSPDVLGFEDLGVMLPHVHLLEKHEGQLLRLFKAYGKSRSSAARQKLDRYLYDNWRPNLTLVDFAYQEKRPGSPSPLLDFTPHKTVADLFAHVPVQVAGDSTRGVLPHLHGFFRFVKDRFPTVRQQSTFDIAIGDMVSYFERAEHGLLKIRDRLGTLQPSTFPDRYDRIHMSNIPDYVGGPLTTFLHGLPILRDVAVSTMTSTVLRNTPQWITHQQFLTEYLLLADRDKIADTFSASLTKASEENVKRTDGLRIGGGGATMAQYLDWTRRSTKPLEWSKLMPRGELQHWLCSLFLKISLPFPRTGKFEHKVIAPLNITMLFRLVAHLFKVGYPAHWLSDVLTNLATGEITTTARAPRSMVTDPAAAKAMHAPRAVSIRPFVAEFRMLLSIWRRLLPFGLLSHETTERHLPALSKIQRYKIRFDIASGFYDLPDQNLSTSSFVLVLWNRTVNGQAPARASLRPSLLHDKSAKFASSLKSTRHESGGGREEDECAVHVVSTMKWEREEFTSTGSFWFPSDVARSITQGQDEWDVYICNTETWTAVLGPVRVGPDTLVGGDTWC
ncbi:hypothetical protein GGR56DRAFT_657542 [Xylariaceae sp. FL0804]|nr:hypothetical protein GGR56DRAFT_657542 [Xylariaceae sp. FL0804]